MKMSSHHDVALYYLSPSVSVHCPGTNKIRFVCTRREVGLDITGIEISALAVFINNLRMPTMITEIRDKAKELGDHGSNIVDRMIESQMLIFCQWANLSDDSTINYDIYRDRLYRWLDATFDSKQANEIRERVEICRIMFIGFGGLGASIAQSLTGYGLRRFLLVDNDRVEITNLSRQTFFRQDDIGHFKVDVGKKRLVSEYKAEDVQVLHEFIQNSQRASELMAEYDPVIVVLTGDRPGWMIAKIVVEASEQTNIPLIRANSRCVTAIHIPNKSQCPCCEWRDIQKKNKGFSETVAFREHCQNTPGATQFEISQLADRTSREIFFFLKDSNHAKGLFRKWIWNGLGPDKQLKNMPAEKDPHCVVCSKRF